MPKAYRFPARSQAKAAKLGKAGVHDPAEGRRRARLACAANDLSALRQATANRRRADPATERRDHPPRPGPRLRNWWGRSALVITDTRVSFSDARICVAASPYVTRHRAQRGPDPGRCCPYCGRMIVIYVTSRNDYELATGR